MKLTVLTGERTVVFEAERGKSLGRLFSMHGIHIPMRYDGGTCIFALGVRRSKRSVQYGIFYFCTIYQTGRGDMVWLHLGFGVDSFSNLHSPHVWSEGNSRKGGSDE